MAVSRTSDLVMAVVLGLGMVCLFLEGELVMDRVRVLDVLNIVKEVDRTSDVWKV